MTVSRSGQTLSPCTQKSSAVLATTVTSASAATPGRRARRDAVEEPLQEARAAHAAGEHRDAAHGAYLCAPSGLARTVPAQ